MIRYNLENIDRRETWKSTVTSKFLYIYWTPTLLSNKFGLI